MPTLPEIAFITEADRLKSILRQSSLYDDSRRENSAEHSWHLALAVMAYRDLADFPFDISRALQIAVLHDVVEIDAGDTFVYDSVGEEDKFARELKAAERIFGLLPDRAAEFKSLWLAYEKQECPESRYVAALDRFLPVLSACMNEGGSWKRHGISKERVIARNKAIEIGSKRLWAAALELIEDCFAKHIAQ